MQYHANKYRLSIPAVFQTRSLPVEDAKLIFLDFIRLIPSRMTQLQRIVTADSDYADWEGDFQRSSLDGLLLWFHSKLFIDDAKTVDCSPLGESRRKGESVPRGEFGNFSKTTESLIQDIGVYWGECLRVHDRAFIWKREFSINNIDYNHPVITGSRIGFSYVPWHNFGHCVIRYFRYREHDALQFAALYDRVLSTPKKPPPKGRTAS